MDFSKKITFEEKEEKYNSTPFKENFLLQGPPELYCETDMGTSIMAVCYDGGVMLGADSRTSSGVYVANRTADKIWPIANNIFSLKSGSAAHTQFLCQITKHYISQFALELNDFPPVKSAANIMRQYQYEYKDYLSAALIVCGWDKINGPQIYSVGLGGTVSRQEIALSGSGSAFIYGFCDVNYKSKMSKQECRDFIVKALSLAMHRDNSSGGIIRLVDINRDGYQRDVIRHDDVLAQNH